MGRDSTWKGPPHSSTLLPAAAHSQLPPTPRWSLPASQQATAGMEEDKLFLPMALQQPFQEHQRMRYGEALQILTPRLG